MKILRYLSACSLLLLFTAGCEKGIDPITAVDPGPDETAPVVSITYPSEGTLVRVPEEVATINIKAAAVDDIELQKVSIQVDGTEVTSFTSFKDYRRYAVDYSYNNVTDGDHTLTVVATDLTGKSSSQTVNFKKVAPYVPMSGEVFYMPFDGDYTELVTFAAAQIHGSPTFADGKKMQAYAGATDAYLTFPTAGLLGSEFSVAFWYKINSVPDRAGMFAISATGDGRTTGFRLFREASGDKQNIGLNFGISASEVWMNPFVQVSTTEDWAHIAISISSSHAAIYVNGSSVLETDITSPLDWTGCSSMTIGSGAPNFTYWNHFSDLSLYDELHLFNKALSAAEVNAIYTGK
ncbi:MAG TPA: Ig-like domain-containing protein [Bacteroidales bacterium]|nr:Ig-like domain-containing protein [Bacteroidales bacterium]